MPVICIGPLCIPLWPLIALTIKPLWDKSIPNPVKEKLQSFWNSFVSSICPRRNPKSVSTNDDSATPDDQIIFGVKDKEHFLRLIRSGESPVIFKFTAEWCGPCHQIQPLVVKLATKYQGRATFAELDIEKLDDLALELGVASIPAFHAYKEGKLVQSFTGANAQKLEELVALTMKTSKS